MLHVSNTNWIVLLKTSRQVMSLMNEGDIRNRINIIHGSQTKSSIKFGVPGYPILYDK